MVAFAVLLIRIRRVGLVEGYEVIVSGLVVHSFFFLYFFLLLVETNLFTPEALAKKERRGRTRTSTRSVRKAKHPRQASSAADSYFTLPLRPGGPASFAGPVIRGPARPGVPVRERTRRKRGSPFISGPWPQEESRAPQARKPRRSVRTGL